jgi:hypothetical protein
MPLNRGQRPRLHLAYRITSGLVPEIFISDFLSSTLYFVVILGSQSNFTFSIP